MRFIAVVLCFSVSLVLLLYFLISAVHDCVGFAVALRSHITRLLHGQCNCVVFRWTVSHIT